MIAIERTVGGVHGDFRMAGYTMVEIIIVVTVISLLVAVSIGWLAPGISGTQVSARDSERQNDAASIALLLEQFYRNKTDASGASYPIGSTVSTDILSLSQADEALQAPGQSSSSLIAASSVGPQNPTKDQYIYQPFDASDALCAARPCLRYTLYYREEASDTVRTIESNHQQ